MFFFKTVACSTHRNVQSFNQLIYFNIILRPGNAEYAGSARSEVTHYLQLKGHKRTLKAPGSSKFCYDTKEK